jgi:hypothetical protein
MIDRDWPILRVAVGGISRKFNGRQEIESRHSQHDRAMIWGKEQLRAKRDTRVHAGRLDVEIKRRTNVGGIFPNEAAITRLIGALLLEQTDEWQLQRRYMQLEGWQSLVDNQLP